MLILYSFLDLGSPQNFRVTRVTSFLIQVSWDSPPIEVYGIFNSYRLYISYSNGSNDSIVLLASSETTFQLEELSPYQMIQFKLSVVYPIGEGPAVTVNQTTLQNGMMTSLSFLLLLSVSSFPPSLYSPFISSMVIFVLYLILFFKMQNPVQWWI